MIGEPIQHKPADFARYWHAIDDDLSRFAPNSELRHSVRRSTSFATSYDLRLTSSGPYRIFGFYSVPEGPGPFPALLQTPRYGSVNNPPHYHDRERYVVLTIMHRGQRLADEPLQAPYPGLLTQGIEASFVVHLSRYRRRLSPCGGMARGETGGR